MKIVVVIPARLHATRLPRKVILDLCGWPMVRYAYESALQAPGIDAVYIATDSEEVRNVCAGFTKHILMTSDSHQSGTDRLAEAVETIDCDGVINIQGDEPLIDPRLIGKLASMLRESKAEMCSAMHRIRHFDELASPHAVKVVVDSHNHALYFSRAAIPHHREAQSHPLNQSNSIPKALCFFKHIGIYGYTKTFLKQFASLPPSSLEKAEKLEQLRALENGYAIKMIETAYEPVGVDTAEDLEKARLLLAQKHHEKER